MNRLSHDEAAELLGAYVLDAVDDNEAAAVEAHVMECPRCRAEVAEHREVVGLVANAGGNAPPHLWDRISEDLADLGSADAPVLSIRPGALPSTAAVSRHVLVLRSAFAALAAAAAVVVVVLGVQVANLDHRVGQLDAISRQTGMVQAVQAALLDPTGQHIALTGATSTALAEVVVLPSGAAYLVDKHLPALASGQTYQLWGKVGSQLVSLSLLGGQPGDVAFYIDPSSHVSLYAVTAERSGGAVQPTSTPVATGI